MKPEDVLFVNRLMQTPEEVRAFDGALERASRVGVSNLDLKRLFDVFDDATRHSDVMFGLVHLVDAFDAASRVACLVERVGVLAEHAPDWLHVLVYRNLNHVPSHAELRRVLHARESSALRAVIEQIAADQTAVGERAQEALREP